MGLTRAVVALAQAARAAGVLRVRLRRGPVAELDLLPADPPGLTAAEGKVPETDEEKRRKRDDWMKEEA